MTNTVDSSSLAPALKHYYTPKKIQSLIYQDAPLLAMLNKNEDFVGDVKVYPIRVSEAQLASASVSQAQTNSQLATSVSNLQAFQITTIEGHAWATISHKSIMQSRNDKGAFLKAGMLAAEDAMTSLKKQIAHGLYRSGYGRIGVIAAISGSTVTLTNIDDVIAFYSGTQVVFALTESNDLLRGSGAALIVQSVDRDQGIITFTAAVSTVASVAVGDSMFVLGNRQNSATPSRLEVTGLAGWFPQTAPSGGDSFFAVNRSSDSLLSGVRVTGSLTSIEDSLVDGALAVARRGGKLDVYMVSFGTYGAILKNASGQIVRDGGTKVADLSFDGVSLNTPKGKVKIVPDYACPDGIAYGLMLDTLELVSMGPLVGQFDLDGRDSIRLATANGIEMRWFSFHQLVCTSPGWNCVVTLS